MTTRPMSQAALDAHQEDLSNYHDALREWVDEFIGDSHSRAELLARITVGEKDYGDWRAESYDTPTVSELIDVAVEWEDIQTIANRLGFLDAQGGRP